MQRSRPPKPGTYRRDGAASARDVFITVYGRMPVLEALRNPRLRVEKVLLAEGGGGEAADAIIAAARDRGVTLMRVPAFRVTHLSRNGRQDQGVVADVEAPRMWPLSSWLDGGDGSQPGLRVLLLDGVATPANVGMIIRTATAAGVDAVVVPRRGSPEIGPLVIKASAGVAFDATILRDADAASAAARLGDAGFRLYGLRSGVDVPLWDAPLSDRCAFVLGGESTGVSDVVAAQIDTWITIPLAPGVDSLNAAAAAAVVCFEVSRRRREG